MKTSDGPIVYLTMRMVELVNPSTGAPLTDTTFPVDEVGWDASADEAA
ncbi:hypothetical protein SAMN07250955_102104 [Arboricoccus pini]|uniref:Uncharacterized protein n=1 Tax=Arboricoccus pini TaxID=1963835 RepID=A0A212QNR2_9PROT|nr:hypothetical protein [Arboricoccus pini]SNB61026.1 hypothetical protein SAMN07250955_102104 [Arboricoccus pini]